jgi:hypothetical protein
MQPTYLLFLPSQRLFAVNARLHAIAIDNWPFTRCLLVLPPGESYCTSFLAARRNIFYYELRCLGLVLISSYSVVTRHYL